jgi:hypothetical protein
MHICSGMAQCYQILCGVLFGDATELKHAPDQSNARRNSRTNTTDKLRRQHARAMYVSAVTFLTEDGLEV